MTVDNEYQRMWKEVIVANSKAPTLCLRVETNEMHKHTVRIVGCRSKVRNQNLSLKCEAAVVTTTSRCLFRDIEICATYCYETYRVIQKEVYTFKNLFYITTDVKSMSCVRMERKSLKVLISMIWSGSSLRLWLLLPVTCCDECGNSWIIDLTSAASHVGLTSSACKVWK
jgi:1-aminocyclopropane-1-carboxylate deaminase/D-cysteine desulfhydrase-like pyridoxal-dependent ACC family enzyme